MEHVSLFLSVHVFTMVPPMYKDMCFNKDVVFGECGHIITSIRYCIFVNVLLTYCVFFF